ncbi:MAG: lipoate-protein ligase A [Planctomycetota bacterium]|jgi:lipoate-protein ligase A
MAPRAWRLLETYDVSPADAMGLDEALLLGSPTSVDADSVSHAEPAPTLRLYTWKPDAISIGYFQAFEDVPAARDHPAVVRRLTGGGAIHHHGGELTFSITLDAKDPAYAGSVPASYERTHEAVMAALRAVGVPGVQMRRGKACASDLPDTGMCFHESTPQDISWAMPGSTALRKGVGTAQRRVRCGAPGWTTGRTKGRILHHGSIKVTGSPLEAEVANVAALAHQPDGLASLAAAFRVAIEAEFDACLQPDEPTPEEWQQAAELGRRYGSSGFVHRAIRRPRTGPGEPLSS